MKKYDLAVVGGGFSGCAAAISAARSGLRVLLAEQGNALGGSAVNCLVNPFMPYWTQKDGKRMDLSEGLFAEICGEMRKISPRAIDGITFNEEYLNQYIDDVVAYLGDAPDRNFEVWGYTLYDDMIEPEERNPRSFEEAVQQIKDFINVRGTWLDEYIETITQYSHYSKNKRFNH